MKVPASCCAVTEATWPEEKDGAASHALQDGDTGPVVADLCAACGAEYADRGVAAVGCTVCCARLALGLTAEYDPEFGRLFDPTPTRLDPIQW